jgi:hypothetical protein
VGTARGEFLKPFRFDSSVEFSIYDAQLITENQDFDIFVMVGHPSDADVFQTDLEEMRECKSEHKHLFPI